MSHYSRVFAQRDREIEHRRHPTPPTIDQTCRNQNHQARRALGSRSATAVDGTRLRAWDNDGHGVPVLISNGLGTPHHAWPDINRRTDTYRAMTWAHRGLGGSERPSDESRISISDHTDDLFAVMDSYGVDRAVVIGWSAGVYVALDAAVRQPPRIAGVLAVGGVPVLRVSQDDDDGVIRVDDDPIRRTAPLGVLSGAVVGVVTALPSG